MAEAGLRLAQAVLGLGLLGALAANLAALWPRLAARAVWTRVLFTGAVAALLLGTLACLWLNQVVDGHAWRWGGAEVWAVAVLLTLWGRTQTQGTARRVWLTGGLLIGLVALARLVASV